MIEQSKRPLIVTIWAVLLGIGYAVDIFNALYAYGVARLDYAELNPGLFQIYRPIAWLAGVAIPVGLWLMRRWAVLLYALLQVSGAALIYFFQPPWAAGLPEWALPVSLVFPALFLITVLPYWGRMSWKAL